MIVHHRIPWMVIAAFILLVCISSSTSVKLRKLRKRSTMTKDPVIVKVIHKYSDDEFTHGVSSNCTHNNCGNSRDKFSSNIDEASSKQDNFRKLKKITLQKVGKYIKLNLSKSLNRTKRNLESDYLVRRNASDYYAQRRAVMERYYARQREINARYANHTTGSITRLRYNGVPQHYPLMNNATRFRIGYLKNSTTENTTSRYPRIDLQTNSRETLSNRIPTELNNRRNIAPENDLDSKSDVNFIQRSNIERNALNYLTTTSCGPTSGTLAPKTRQKSKHCNETESEEDSVTINTPGSERWGECKGKLVYQHNLLLGLTGPSNLNAIFEVIIEGSVCITCVETLRYNETKAKVALVSGGRGFEYAKLKLEGHENEGFSYIIKIWGVKKIGQDCSNVE